MKLGLLNTSIVTTTGTYKMVDLTLAQAKDLAQANKDNLLSAIGHNATADVLKKILGVDVQANRIIFTQDVGQQAIVLKIKGRLPDDVKDLTIDDMHKIGFDLFLLTRLD
jgi:Domain of unknown function (DUF1874).